MSNTALAARPVLDARIVQSVLIDGDLSGLSPQEKIIYYDKVCDSLDLNRLTKPFAYMKLQNKEQLYATKNCTDQLRNIHNITIKITAREIVEDCYVVTAVATMPNGREDEDIGAVPIASLRGEFRANAMMKAITKAKRRVTLSICGLGMLDETEAADIPNVKISPAPASPSVPAASTGAPDGGNRTPPGDDAALVDRVTGEVLPPPGFHYVKNYKRRGPAHIVTVEKWDAQGGALEVSTIYKWGNDLKKAAIEHLPVRLAISPKGDNPGEAYCDSVEFYEPPAPVAASTEPPAELPPDLPDPKSPVDDDYSF